MLIIKHLLAIKMLELGLFGFDSLPLASWGKKKRKEMKTTTSVYPKFPQPKSGSRGKEIN